MSGALGLPPAEAAAAARDAGIGPAPALAPAELPLGAPINALAIDTSSDVLALALLRRGALVAAQHETIGRRTTQEILPRIAALLSGAELSPRALDVLVVARGPGSFTGTRIGMAVALTFAQVTARPLVGVDALTVLAAQTAPPAARPGPAFAVLLNCARDEVYHARYRWQAGGLARESAIALSTLEHLRPSLGDEPVVLRRFYPGVGTTPAVEAAFAALARLPLAHGAAAGAPAGGPAGAPEGAPDATRLLAVGIAAWQAEPARDWRRVEPIYLKSEAFRTWRPAP